MTRNRASAKKAGTAFESALAAWLAERVNPYVVRRARTGAKDCGDIANLRTRGGRRIVVEAKNCARMDLAGWVREAEVERVNDQATVGVVVHKRRGKADPAEQYVTMTLRDFAALVTEERAE